MFVMALFIKVPNWKQLKCLLTTEWRVVVTLFSGVLYFAAVKVHYPLLCTAMLRTLETACGMQEAGHLRVHSISFPPLRLQEPTKLIY